MRRSLSDYFVITLKGAAMGAADVVPGVSGGTIAFISGIYEELITSFNNLDLSIIRTLRTEGIKAAWKRANGNFLLALVTGIAISIFSLVKLIRWLLENEPILLWSFFFGLVLASTIFVGREIKDYRIRTWIVILVSALLACYITTLPSLGSTDQLWYLFLCGTIAICAMILPGISGAFILLLLGAYERVVTAVDERDLKVLGAFGLGAVLGLVTFSKLLKYAYTHHRVLTLAVLTGLIVGSLRVIWPWKKVLTTRINSKGEEVAVLTESVLPSQYDGDPQLWAAILLMVLGAVLIFVLEKIANRK